LAHATLTCQACAAGQHWLGPNETTKYRRSSSWEAAPLNEGQMLFPEIIFKNLRQRTTRTVLTIVGLAAAVAAMTTLWTISWGYATSASRYYSARGVDIVVVRAGVSNRLTSRLQSELADRIRSLPGVESVDGSLTEMVSLRKNHLLGIPMRGYLPTGSTLRSFTIRNGRSLDARSSGVVLLGAGLADALEISPGQQIEIESTPFSVVGIFEGNNPFDANSIVAPLADVQRLMGRTGIVSELQVRATGATRNETGLRQLCDTIESLQTDQHEPLGLAAQPTRHFIDSAYEERLSSEMAWATTAIVVTLSLIGMLNTMLMSVVERTKELGVLRAIGWKRSSVVQMILGESALIGIAGALVGVSASWLLMMILRQWPATSLLVPDDISVPAIGFGGAAAIFAAISGSFYPSYHAASIPPVESLRHE
jgi:putative ABC transport system permease protein